MPDRVFGTGPQKSVSLVLAGGVALGAYEAGAYAALHDHVALRPEWLAGSSIGAVNAAIIAGNPVDRRIERLQQFWGTTGADPFPISSFWMGRRAAGPVRQAQNEAAVQHRMGQESFSRRIDLRQELLIEYVVRAVAKTNEGERHWSGKLELRRILDKPL